MSPPPLCLSLEPQIGYTQMLLTMPTVGTLLKARLSSEPAHPGALTSFLQGLALWSGLPLFVVLDADAEEVLRHPEKWARMMGDAAQSPSITVQWSCPPPARLYRDKFFDRMGDFSSARRMLVHAATGQK